MPYVSVVVPARDEARRLPDCLSHLMKQTHREVEVIVVDNGSRDATARIARMHGCRVVSVSAPGVGRARQAGFEAATGEIVASTDADTRVPPD